MQCPLTCWTTNSSTLRNWHPQSATSKPSSIWLWAIRMKTSIRNLFQSCNCIRANCLRLVQCLRNSFTRARASLAHFHWGQLMTSGRKSSELDLGAFAPGTVAEYTTSVCLACIFDIFTAQFGLAPRTAYSEIKRYSPSVEELTGPKATRPFFDSEEKNPHCPYCNAARRWHARFNTVRIEGGKATDAVRGELIKLLPK